MIRLHIMLNNRRRFVISAALGTLLVLLAGGANALAITVWSVSKTSSVTTCSLPSATTCNNITSAVTAAAWGDAVFIGPGTYNESVTINNLMTLLGAQAGNDARVDRHDPTKESIVNGEGGPAFIVHADGVVIDGFTVTGGTGTGATTPPGGIFLPGWNFPQVLNTIIEENSMGIYLGGTSAVIEHNLFRNNNAPNGGTVGFGIYATNATSPLITENKFTGNETTAIAASGGSNVIITNNTSENDASFLVCRTTTNMLFSNNHGKNFGQGGDPGPRSFGAAVAVAYGNVNLVISDNDLEKGEAPTSNGIAFTTVIGLCGGSSPPCPNSNVNVTHNKVKGFPGNGIVAEGELVSGGPVGMLFGSWIAGNEVRDNGSDGIFIDFGNYNIELLDNEAEGDHVLDCNDTSTDGGTLGTSNYWFNNIGNSSFPTGLCTPGRWQGND